MSVAEAPAATRAAKTGVNDFALKLANVNGTEDEVRSRLTTPAKNADQALFVSAALPQTGRIMVKDENLCVHCGLCAERCPTAAWDMQKSEVVLPYALTPLPMVPVGAGR